MNCWSSYPSPATCLLVVRVVRTHKASIQAKRFLTGECTEELGGVNIAHDLDEDLSSISGAANLRTIYDKDHIFFEMFVCLLKHSKNNQNQYNRFSEVIHNRDFLYGMTDFIELFCGKFLITYLRFITILNIVKSLHI